MTEKQKTRLEELRQQVKNCPPDRALHILGKKKLEELLKLEIKATTEINN